MKHPARNLHLLSGKLYVEVVPYPDPDGYLRCTITESGRTENCKVHRLLWEIYNQRTIPAGCLVRHLNDVKTDNRETNLALGSHLDNARDRARNRGELAGESNPARKLDEEAVRLMRRLHAQGQSISQIQKEFSYVSVGTVASVVRWRSWKHVT